MHRHNIYDTSGSHEIHKEAIFIVPRNEDEVIRVHFEDSYVCHINCKLSECNLYTPHIPHIQ